MAGAGQQLWERFCNIENAVTIPSDVDIKAGTATVSQTANTLNAALLTRRVDVFLYDAATNAFLQMSPDGQNWRPAIELIGSGYYSFPFKGRSFRIYTETGTCRYTIAAWN